MLRRGDVMTGIIVDMIQRFINYLSLEMPRFEIDAAYMSKVSDAVSVVRDFILNVNFILPLGDIALIMLICFSIWGSKVVIFITNWVIRRVCDLIP